jgi:hypothetical protein
VPRTRGGGGYSGLLSPALSQSLWNERDNAEAPRESSCQATQPRWSVMTVANAHTRLRGHTSPPPCPAGWGDCLPSRAVAIRSIEKKKVNRPLSLCDDPHATTVAHHHTDTGVQCVLPSRYPTKSHRHRALLLKQTPQPSFKLSPSIARSSCCMTRARWMTNSTDSLFD